MYHKYTNSSVYWSTLLIQQRENLDKRNLVPINKTTLVLKFRNEDCHDYRQNQQTHL